MRRHAGLVAAVACRKVADPGPFVMALLLGFGFGMVVGALVKKDVPWE